MNRLARVAVVALVVAAVAGWWLTRPSRLAESDLPEHSPSAAAGERMFWAGGCASCHASPVDGKRARGDDKFLLGGGLQLDTAFGVFHVPNISSHEEDGIGGWSMLDFVNAMQLGTTPDGRHYYPAFPFASYAKMNTEDVMDLRAYLATLPPVAGRAPAHELGFPWSLRRGVGIWKRLYLDDKPVVAFDTVNERLERGRRLVEAAGHCGECHTPRGPLGGMLADRWLAGAPSLENEGTVPNITPGGKQIADWTEGDIAYYLESGFTPEFDTVGGAMVAVQEGFAQLSPDDRAAVAAYLKALPALD